GLFGVAEFMNSVNQQAEINTMYTNVRLRDMRPTKEDIRRSFFPMLRGTIVGSLCALIPGTGPTIASPVAHAARDAIVGPVPGIRAHRLPTIVPRSIGKKERLMSSFVGRMSRRRTFVYIVLISACWFTLFMNSATPNRP